MSTSHAEMYGRRAKRARTEKRLVTTWNAPSTS